MDDDFSNNVILTQTEGLTMNNRPKQPKYARNKNILVIGGSGSGKTRFFVKPNLMQMHSSYVVTDPKGTVLVGVLAAATQKDADASKLEKGGWVAKNATQYNHQLHKSQADALDEQRRFHPEKADRLVRRPALWLVAQSRSRPTMKPIRTSRHFRIAAPLLVRRSRYLKATGQFGGRSWQDWSDDTLNAHGKAVQVVGASKDTALGLV